ncbi:MAG: nucleoside-diphosphate kinase [Polyangiaceae bacterium]|nr:nucleoside-diphosphate kinase [Polyangiaceae bacterium]
MARQQTLAMIKPDILQSKRQGALLQRILDEGFEVLAMKQLHLSQEQASGFYAEHQGKPFFENLCRFMTSGPLIVLALEREDAVRQWREVLGKTDPQEAAPGTIRQLFGSTVTINAAHGSDSVENGQRECHYFFSDLELR